MNTEILTDVLLHYGELVQAETQQIVLAQGKKGYGLCVLIQGKMAVTIKIPGQGIKKLTSLNPGQFFGEINLLQNTPCTATVKCQRKSIYFSVSKSVFNMLRIALPEIHFQLSQDLVRKIIEIQSDITEKIKALSATKVSKCVDLHIFKKKSLKKSLSVKKKKVDYLRRVSLFEYFKAEEFNKLITMATLIELPDKYEFMQKNSCFIILNGAVIAGIKTEKDYTKFTVLGPNQLLCSTAVIEHDKELFCYLTTGPATLLEITASQLAIMQKNHPLLWYKIHDLAVRYFASLQVKLNTQLIRMSREN